MCWSDVSGRSQIVLPVSCLALQAERWGAAGVAGEGGCDLDANLISLCVPGDLGESPPDFPGLHILKGVRHSRESITVVHMGPRA